MKQLGLNRVGATRLQVPSLGLGCAQLGNLYKEMPDRLAREVVGAAWDQGIGLFDTAPHYGQGLSERRLGDALRQPDRRGHVLSTKVGRLLTPAGYAADRHGFVCGLPFDIVYDYSYDGVMRSFEDSQQRLGLDRIDILLMHDIGRATHGARHEEVFEVAMDGGYRAMEELRANRDVRAIGVGANEIEACAAALEHAQWDCFLLAGRYTLLEQEALRSFLPACRRRSCSVLIGGPYNSGVLASGASGGGTAYFDYRPAPPDVLQRVVDLELVCRRHNVPLAAAALQFPLAHPVVASVMPGIDSVERVEQTLELLRTPIPGDLWHELKASRLLAQDAPTPRAD